MSLGQILRRSKAAACYFSDTTETQNELCRHSLHKSVPLGQLSPWHEYIQRDFVWQHLKPTH